MWQWSSLWHDCSFFVTINADYDTYLLIHNPYLLPHCLFCMLFFCTSWSSFVCVCVCLCVCVSTSLHHTAVHLNAASQFGCLVNMYNIKWIMVNWYRMAWMPCTRLHKVDIWKWSSSSLSRLGQGSVTETTMMTPFCTGLLIQATIRWHATWSKNWRWIHRTGTRCVGWHGKEDQCAICPMWSICVC